MARYLKGQSGNVAGRPVGSQNKRTAEIRQALEAITPTLFTKLAELLERGDATAIKILADRILPRKRLLILDLPDMRTLEGCAAALDEVIHLTASGQVDSSEAADLAALIERRGSAIERTTLAERLAEIEKKLGEVKDA